MTKQSQGGEYPLLPEIASPIARNDDTSGGEKGAIQSRS